MTFTQPTLLHILYVESDAVQIAKYAFLNPQPRSIWLEVEEESELGSIKERLAQLHKTGRIKLFLVSVCENGDESDLLGLQDELDRLERHA
jgi:hypothetical protein